LEHTRAALEGRLGDKVEVLVSGPAKSGKGKFTARTPWHFNIILPADAPQAGVLGTARVTGHTGMTLISDEPAVFSGQADDE
ncbi:MAG: hypothetical protein U9P14_09730, partial [Gemmatimonadota bacterium]|nr:hypothetical protein [Gemmatimonadota bacterium]